MTSAVTTNTGFSTDAVSGRNKPPRGKPSAARAARPETGLSSPDAGMRSRAARLLRIFGAFAFAASMSVFLMQGWESGEDINRYFIMLGQTMLLAAGGLGLSYLLDENKGARVFLGLCLLSVATNFTTLGAFTFSYFQGSVDPSQYPGFLLWSLSDTAAMLSSTAAGLVLIPITFFSFMVLARRHAVPASALFLLANGLLLIPVREPLVITLFAAAIVTAAIQLIKTCRRKNPTPLTLETGFAFACLFLPAGILIGRCWWLYQPDALSETLLAVLIFAMLRTAYAQVRLDGLAGKTFEIALIAMAFVIPILALPIADRLLADILILPVLSLIASALLIELSDRLDHFKQLGRKIAATSLQLAVVLNMLASAGMLSSSIVFAAGILVTCAGKCFADRYCTISGLVIALLGLVCFVIALSVSIDLFNWLSLAVCGAVAIITGSILERHGIAINAVVNRLLKADH